MSSKRKSGRYPWSDGDHEGLHTNESYVKKTLKKVDKLLLDFMSDMMRENWNSLEELDPEKAALINRYIRAWKDLCGDAVAYAQKEDEIQNGLIKRLERMEEKEDRILDILYQKNLKL